MSITEAPSSAVERLRLFRRATNYIAAAMIYLQDNAELRAPLRAETSSPTFGTLGNRPGINLIYAGINDLILDTGASVLLVTGPGHGAPANLANLWIDGCLEDISPVLPATERGSPG